MTEGENIPQEQPADDSGAPGNKKTAQKKQIGDNLSIGEKILAGILLVLFTILSITLILAYWPDRLPLPNEGIKPLYIYERFNIRLACIKENCCCIDSVLADIEAKEPMKAAIDTAAAKKQDANKTGGQKQDTTKVGQQKKDSDRKVNPTVPGTTTVPTGGSGMVSGGLSRGGTADGSGGLSVVKYPCNIPGVELIDLNMLMLILVALGGFLGNMIHIATSFTNYVGSRAFRRSWILWYFVKPFTAAAMAMGLYFVFRAGFLNYSADPAGINLYGVMTVAILAGLFTDRATLKLGEVFEVVFSIKKDAARPDPMLPIQYKFDTPPSPDKLSKTLPNKIFITGQNLDKGHLIFTMKGTVLPENAVQREATKIIIQYAVPTEFQNEKDITLSVRDDNNNERFNWKFELI